MHRRFQNTACTKTPMLQGSYLTVSNVSPANHHKEGYLKAYLDLSCTFIRRDHIFTIPIIYWFELPEFIFSGFDCTVNIYECFLEIDRSVNDSLHVLGAVFLRFCGKIWNFRKLWILLYYINNAYLDSGVPCLSTGHAPLTKYPAKI